MSALAAVPSSNARFAEVKTLAALANPLRSTGTLEYRRPDHLAKRTLAPFPEALVVDGDRLSLSEGDDAPKTIDLAAQPEIAALVDTVRGLLAGNLPVLSRLYRPRLEGSLALWRLTLEPAGADLARFVRLVQIDGAGTELRAIRTEQANGDEDLLTVDPIR